MAIFIAGCVGVAIFIGGCFWEFKRRERVRKADALAKAEATLWHR